MHEPDELTDAQADAIFAGESVDADVESTLADIRVAYLRPAPSTVRAEHLALAGGRPAAANGMSWTGLAGLVVLVTAGLLLATGGLAAADALPQQIQDVVAEAVEPLGVDLPSSDDGPGNPDKSDGPGLSEDAPGQGGTGPGNSENAPGQDGDSPGNSENAPGQDGDTPGNSENAPGQDEDSPGNSENAPGQTGENPGQGNSENAPGQSETPPGNSGNAPGKGKP